MGMECSLVDVRFHEFLPLLKGISFCADFMEWAITDRKWSAGYLGDVPEPPRSCRVCFQFVDVKRWLICPRPLAVPWILEWLSTDRPLGETARLANDCHNAVLVTPFVA